MLNEISRHSIIPYDLEQERSKATNEGYNSVEVIKFHKLKREVGTISKTYGNLNAKVTGNLKYHVTFSKKSQGHKERS